MRQPVSTQSTSFLVHLFSLKRAFTNEIACFAGQGQLQHGLLVAQHRIPKDCVHAGLVAFAL
jgi:hypothetical protein